MIKANIQLTTTDGFTIPSGSVIDITPTFKSYRTPSGESYTWNHQVIFGMDLFKSMSDFETGKDSIKSSIVNLPPVYVLDVTFQQLQSITSIAVPQEWLKTHLESVFGQGTMEIVYPSI